MLLTLIMFALFFLIAGVLHALLAIVDEALRDERGENVVGPTDSYSGSNLTGDVEPQGAGPWSGS